MCIRDRASYHRELYKAYAANKENRKAAEDNSLPEWYEMTERGGLRFLSGLLANHLAQNVDAFYATSSFFFYQSGVYREGEEDVYKRQIPADIKRFMAALTGTNGRPVCWIGISEAFRTRFLRG